MGGAVCVHLDFFNHNMQMLGDCVKTEVCFGLYYQHFTYGWALNQISQIDSQAPDSITFQFSINLFGYISHIVHIHF